MKKPEKTALITGACGGGIGRSTALTLAREGYSVAINYRSHEEAARQVAEAAAAMGADAAVIQGDIFIKEDCARLVNKTLEIFGRLDVCIVGPGAGWNCEPVWALDSEASAQDVQQEVLPVYHLLPLVAPEMEKRRWGRFLAFSSNMDCPSPSYSYNTAKSARTAAVLGAAASLWEKGITANVISPGPVEPFSSLQEAVDACRKRSGGRTGISPQEIAEAAAFLCSEQAGYLTGTELKFRF